MLLFVHNGRCRSTLRPFGVFVTLWYVLWPFWYVVSGKIWQPWFAAYFSPNLVTLSDGVNWNFRFSGQPLPVQARMALHFADFSPGCISQSLI
jgi:hypothetical protein